MNAAKPTPADKIRQIKEAIAAYERALETGVDLEGAPISGSDRTWLAKQIVVAEGNMARILGAMPW